MTIKTTAWHYRVYSYWARYSPTYRAAYQENLCHYVRVLLFWAPTIWLNRRTKAWHNRMRILLGVGIVLFYAALIVLLMVALGVEYPIPFALAWGSLFALIGVLVVLYTAWKWSRGKQIIPQAVKDTGGLAWNYSRAKKRRICPFIEFDAA